MPLSEFHSLVKGKHDSGQPKVPNCSSAPQSPFVPEQDFVELLWENGHVVQSSRPKKSPFPGAFPSLSGKAKEKEGRDAVEPVRDAVAPRSGCRYGGTDALGNGLQATGPSGQIGLGGQDDELVPWLNCPIDDYCSEFLSEFSGINPNSLSTTVPAERISGFGQATRCAYGGAENGSIGSRGPTGPSEAGCRMNSSQFFQFPQAQYQMSSSSNIRPREAEVTMGAADQGHRGGWPPAAKVHKPDLTAPSGMPMQPPHSSTPVMNFSHFTRPVALVKANLLGTVDRVMRGGEKASAAASGNPLESALIEYAGGSKGTVSASRGRVAPVTAKADLNPTVQPSEGMALVGHSSPEAICREDATNKADSRSLKKTDDPSSRRMMSDHTKCQDSNFKAAGQPEAEDNSCHEPAIASPSVCSGIGASAAANDGRSRARWKCTEGEESEYPSEDREDDSTDVVRRPVAGGQGTSKKRSRAAEVHNLSERRRRDRINEKMRALQELIPNCNKVDKASMLDEAIEYLKTLQMQVQIMSMGGGLCMPPMMLPTGLQGMRAPHMGPFSPMAAVGMGMGMGLGFGMGMLDMTRAPTLMPLPRLHVPPYPSPCASIPGTAAGLHGMAPGSAAAANLQMFGMPPAGQPMPMSMPHPPPPFIPLVGGMTANANPVREEPVAEVQASDSAPPPPNSKDQAQQLNMTLEQAAAKTGTVDTPAESSGRRANRDCFELPSMVQVGNQPPNVGGR